TQTARSTVKTFSHKLERTTIPASAAAAILKLLSKLHTEMVRWRLPMIMARTAMALTNVKESGRTMSLIMISTTITVTMTITTMATTAMAMTTKMTMMMMMTTTTTTTTTTTMTKMMMTTTMMMIM
ncbi:Hypothetical Protein FCC1311_080561, partial [Hondaea fermentalgiana]